MARLVILPNLEMHTPNFPHERLPNGVDHLVCTLYSVVRVGLELPESFEGSLDDLSATISLHIATNGAEVTRASRTRRIVEKRATQKQQSIDRHGEEKALSLIHI